MFAAIFGENEDESSSTSCEDLVPLAARDIFESGDCDLGESLEEITHTQLASCAWSDAVLQSASTTTHALSSPVQRLSHDQLSSFRQERQGTRSVSLDASLDQSTSLNGIFEANMCTSVGQSAVFLSQKRRLDCQAPGAGPDSQRRRTVSEDFVCPIGLSFHEYPLLASTGTCQEGVAPLPATSSSSSSSWATSLQCASSNHCEPSPPFLAGSQTEREVSATRSRSFSASSASTHSSRSSISTACASASSNRSEYSSLSKTTSLSAQSRSTSHPLSGSTCSSMPSPLAANPSVQTVGASTWHDIGVYDFLVLQRLVEQVFVSGNHSISGSTMMQSAALVHRVRSSDSDQQIISTLCLTSSESALLIGGQFAGQQVHTSYACGQNQMAILGFHWRELMVLKTLSRSRSAVHSFLGIQSQSYPAESIDLGLNFSRFVSIQAGLSPNQISLHSLMNSDALQAHVVAMISQRLARSAVQIAVASPSKAIFTLFVRLLILHLMADALRALHSLGIAHGSLCPQHVILFIDSGFGAHPISVSFSHFAVMTRSVHLQQNKLVASLDPVIVPYLSSSAAEQIAVEKDCLNNWRLTRELQSLQVSKRDDLFAFGAMAFEFLSLSLEERNRSLFSVHWAVDKILRTKRKTKNDQFTPREMLFHCEPLLSVGTDNQVSVAQDLSMCVQRLLLEHRSDEEAEFVLKEECSRLLNIAIRTLSSNYIGNSAALSAVNALPQQFPLAPGDFLVASAQSLNVGGSHGPVTFFDTCGPHRYPIGTGNQFVAVDGSGAPVRCPVLPIRRAHQLVLLTLRTPDVARTLYTSTRLGHIRGRQQAALQLLGHHREGDLWASCFLLLMSEIKCSLMTTACDCDSESVALESAAIKRSRMTALVTPRGADGVRSLTIAQQFDRVQTEGILFNAIDTFMSSYLSPLLSRFKITTLSDFVVRRRAQKTAADVAMCTSNSVLPSEPIAHFDPNHSPLSAGPVPSGGLALDQQGLLLFFGGLCLQHMDAWDLCVDAHSGARLSQLSEPVPFATSASLPSLSSQLLLLAAHEPFNCRLAQSHLGRRCAQSGRVSEAEQWYTRAAEQGHVTAMFNLAMSLLREQNVSPGPIGSSALPQPRPRGASLVDSVAHFRTADGRGHFHSLLGMPCPGNHGAEFSPRACREQRGVSLLMSLSALDYPPACMALGQHFESQQALGGVEALHRAFACYSRAVELGLSDAAPFATRIKPMNSKSSNIHVS